MVVEILRKELVPAAWRVAAGRVKDGRVARRILALALVLEGWIGLRRRAVAGWTGRPCDEADQGTFRMPDARRRRRRAPRPRQRHVETWRAKQ